jgi:hypothetical protein
LKETYSKGKLSGQGPELINQVAKGKEGYPLESHVKENVDIGLLFKKIESKNQNLYF